MRQAESARNATNALERGEDEVAVSVVIPIYNEVATLDVLNERLVKTLESTHRSFEIWYVDDGSTDGSLERLRHLADADPRVGVVELARNFGQHAALLAGFSTARGAVVVTLDGDLQNPPEEIPRLLAEIDQGHDVVGGWRRKRHDHWFRRLASQMTNRVTSIAVGVPMRDYGCMLRAYRRDVIEQLIEYDERALFIPALANSLARRAVEIEVDHAEREHGVSRYHLLKLMRLGFDLLTGFSLLPIQLVSIFGVFVGLGGFGFGLFLFARRLIVGPENEGVFTLFAILFSVLGVLILAVGIVGEYIGRIYLEVRRRPTFRIRAIHRSRTEA
jgi:undecaprenyl-phosphate 4-deoxy-4-formamido-L-arabinose transferase